MFGLDEDVDQNFISLGNELKPEQPIAMQELKKHFISLGNELKPEPSNPQPP